MNEIKQQTLFTSPKQGLRWRVSAKWCTHRFNCTEEWVSSGKCIGCCGPKSYWSPNRVNKDNPSPMCPQLGEKGCRLSPADKPVGCLLYPLIVDKRGLITIHIWTTLKHGCCRGAYNQGPPIFEALRGFLVEVFGEEQYQRVLKDINSGIDSYFDVSEDIAFAQEIEEEFILKGLPPFPRTRMNELREKYKHLRAPWRDV